MPDFRERFTKWYVSKGYSMDYKHVYTDDGESELIFRCPFWIRPLTGLLFSPSIYYHESYTGGVYA